MAQAARRLIRVELTVPQAEALSSAACEVMAGEGASDVLDRAWTKLARAIAAASRNTRSTR